MIDGFLPLPEATGLLRGERWIAAAEESPPAVRRGSADCHGGCAAAPKPNGAKPGRTRGSNNAAGTGGSS